MGDDKAMQPPTQHTTALTALRSGNAEGRLLGGCLSLVVCTIGTPFQPDTRDTILFLEDRGERLYAIDRMLTYLKLAGVFEGVRGLVFGSLDPVAADRDRPYGMTDVILDVLGDMDVPILANFPSRSLPPAFDIAVWRTGCDSRQSSSTVRIARRHILTIVRRSTIYRAASRCFSTASNPRRNDSGCRDLCRSPGHADLARGIRRRRSHANRPCYAA